MIRIALVCIASTLASVGLSLLFSWTMGYSSDAIGKAATGQFGGVLLLDGYVVLISAPIGLALGLLWQIAWAQWHKHTKIALPKSLAIHQCRVRWLVLASVISSILIGFAWQRGAFYDTDAQPRIAVREDFRDFQKNQYAAQWNTQNYMWPDIHSNYIYENVTPRSYEYFDEMKTGALSFEVQTEQLMMMPPLERMWLIAMRSMFSYSELVILEKHELMSEFYLYLTTVRLSEELCPFYSTEIGYILVEDERASVFEDSEQTVLMAVLHKQTDGTWLVDYQDSMAAWEIEFARQIEKFGVSAKDANYREFYAGSEWTGPPFGWDFQYKLDGTGKRILTPFDKMVMDTGLPLPSTVMDGPFGETWGDNYDPELFDLLSHRTKSNEKSVEAPIAEPVTLEGMRSSESPFTYVAEAFRNGLIGWKSAVTWQMIDENTDVAKFLFKLAYESVEYEDSRVECLNRGLVREPGIVQSYALELAANEPSLALAETLLATFRQWSEINNDPRSDKWPPFLVMAMGKSANDEIRTICKNRAAVAHFDRVSWAEALAATDLDAGVQLLENMYYSRDRYNSIRAKKSLDRLGVNVED